MRHIVLFSESSRREDSDVSFFFYCLNPPLVGLRVAILGWGVGGCLSIDEATPHPNEGWGVGGCLFIDKATPHPNWGLGVGSCLSIDKATPTQIGGGGLGVA